jgi:hypothetical protein
MTLKKRPERRIQSKEKKIVQKKMYIKSHLVWKRNTRKMI